MFTLFKKKKEMNVKAVVEGSIKALEDVQDEVFSKGLIGRGLAIVPTGDTICAPIDGTLTVVFPTAHAFGLTSEDGLEYLIHIGVDTVNLKGEGFQLFVKQGDTVKQGDPLVKVDFSKIIESGYPIDTILLVTSAQEACSFKQLVEAGKEVTKADDLFHCEKA